MYSIDSNGGGGGGGAPEAHAPPPQPAGKGASASTARAIPVHAVVGSDRLAVCFLISTTKKLWPDTIINAEGAWFVPKKVWSQKFHVCAPTVYGSKHWNYRN